MRRTNHHWVELHARSRALLVGVLLALASACANLEFTLPSFAAGEGAVPAGYEGVDALLRDAVSEGRAAGISALVLREGSIDYLQVHGELTLGSGRPLRTDSICRVYSMTKALTSVAVMMLWEEGRIGLDDPVESYLPEWGEVEVGRYQLSGFSVVPRERSITIRDLLRHTSGIPYHSWMPAPYPELYRKEFGEGAMVFGPEQATSLADFSERLARLPLVHQPGFMWTYGASTDVLGRVIEVVSGQPFDEFLSERLLAPLEMVDTAFWVPEEKWGRFSALHNTKDGGRVSEVDEGGWASYRKAPASPSGGGGLVSTLQDYAIFLQMLVEGGEWRGRRYLRESTMNLMTDPSSAQGGPHPLFNDWGLGFEVISEKNEEKGWGLEGAYSWSGVARTHFLVDPEHELVLLLYQQTQPFEVGMRNEVFAEMHRALGLAPEGR